MGRESANSNDPRVTLAGERTKMAALEFSLTSFDGQHKKGEDHSQLIVGDLLPAWSVVLAKWAMQNLNRIRVL
jgi:hypothetical protein